MPKMKSVVLFAIFVNAIAHLATGTSPLLPFESQSDAKTPQTTIDKLVFDNLKELGIQPANRCSDSVFLRRVYLDVIGTLPAAGEAAAFLNDKSPNKRSVLIDQLLERSEFADYWGMKWGDVLRVKSEFPVNLWPDAAQAYDHWIRESIRRNVPYSKFVGAMLTTGGSNFRDPEVNFYRSAGSKDPKAIARAVALAFMGERVENWPAAKLDGMAAFFSQIGFKSTGEWKEEIVYFNGTDDTQHTVTHAVLPDGTAAELPPGRDPRGIFALWLASSKNSPLAANAVNRLWYWLMGRGIIHEPDDSRPDNPPSNPRLLAWLAQELVSSNYDMKHVLRLILNSDTYQLSSIPASKDPKAETNFAYYTPRRLDAEVIIDAIDEITGSKEEYSSQIPEPFTFVPTSTHSVALPDGSITSGFLELFGRPPRDTGLLSERNNHVTAAQRLHLLNSSMIQLKLTRSDKLRALIRSGQRPAEILDQLYLTFLSRYPTQDEAQAVKAYSQTSEAKGADILYDTAWALVNSTEFLYRH